MTIGSTHNHPANIAIEPTTPVLPWAARFPNPPDLCFDYRRLLEQYCLRTAIDTVINLCSHTDARFRGDFTLDDYPHYQIR
ncbi:hypothetical protein [Pseudomonas sp. GZD-209]|uniref:hypothetical protein n=1 Tax=Pseudomonas sp. GZD-209 TaxID=3404807 RepID=UPI003BB4C38D